MESTRDIDGQPNRLPHRMVMLAKQPHGQQPVRVGMDVNQRLATQLLDMADLPGNGTGIP